MTLAHSKIATALSLVALLAVLVAGPASAAPGVETSQAPTASLETQAEPAPASLCFYQWVCVYDAFGSYVCAYRWICA